MAYDEELAGRIRAAVEAATGPAGYREIKMFGGLCWTVNTHMAVGTAVTTSWSTSARMASPTPSSTVPAPP